MSGLSSEQLLFFFFFQAEDGIRDLTVTGVQTCALPISGRQAQCDDQQDRRQAACEKHVQPPFHETVITGKECSKRQTDCPGENLGGLSEKLHKILEVLDIMRSTVFAKLFIGGIAYPPLFDRKRRYERSSDCWAIQGLNLWPLACEAWALPLSLSLPLTRQ